MMEYVWLGVAGLVLATLVLFYTRAARYLRMSEMLLSINEARFWARTFVRAVEKQSKYFRELQEGFAKKERVMVKLQSMFTMDEDRLSALIDEAVVDMDLEAWSDAGNAVPGQAA